MCTEKGGCISHTWHYLPDFSTAHLCICCSLHLDAFPSFPIPQCTGVWDTINVQWMSWLLQGFTSEPVILHLWGGILGAATSGGRLISAYWKGLQRTVKWKRSRSQAVCLTTQFFCKKRIPYLHICLCIEKSALTMSTSRESGAVE